MDIEFWRNVLMAWRHCNALIGDNYFDCNDELGVTVDRCQELIEKLDDSDFDKLVAHGVDCADWRE